MAVLVALQSLVKAARGVRQSGRILREFQPDVVFVTGGFVAAPVVWAAWRAGIPVLIYLPDIEPGVAIRRLSCFASRVAVSFPEVAQHFPSKAVVTGYPVRTELVAAAAQRDAARQALDLLPAVPVLLVFGGSRGARSINQALAAALPGLLPQCQIVHISGAADWPQVQERARDLPEELRARYHPYAYLHAEMAQAMAAADLAVARAGASTLGEFPMLGLPSILVPYPFSGQHQEVNADYLANRGAAVKLADNRLHTDLLPTALDLLRNPGQLAAMQQAARALAQPQAAVHIGNVLIELAQGNGTWSEGPS